MTKDIKITITGPPKSGKSRLVKVLHNFLTLLNYRVDYVDKGEAPFLLIIND